MQSEVVVVVSCWFPLVQFGWLAIGYFRKRTHHKDPDNGSVTVVIPFRNEELDLANLVEHLNALRIRPNDRIVLVDDCSTDAGIQAMPAMRAEVTVIRLTDETGGSKKRALSVAIEHAATDWILTTDADCSFAPDWLERMRAFAWPDIHMLIGSVLSHRVSGITGIFQRYESVCLWVITRATAGWNTPILCSGANLMFRRSSWLAVNGYEGHSNRSSGDDVLLMHDFSRRWPRGICSVSDPLALTEARGESTWKSIFTQRKRWSSKAAHFSGIKRGVLLAGLFCWLYFPLVSLLMFPGFAAALLIAEAVLVAMIQFGSKRRFNMLHWLLFRLAYPVFLLILVAYSPGSLSWKGRKVN